MAMAARTMAGTAPSMPPPTQQQQKQQPPTSACAGSVAGPAKRKRRRRCLALFSSRTATLLLACLALLVHSRVFVWLGRINVSLHQHHHLLHEHHHHHHHRHQLGAHAGHVETVRGPASSAAAQSEVGWDLFDDDEQDVALAAEGLLAAGLSRSSEGTSDTDPFLPGQVASARRPRPLRFSSAAPLTAAKASTRSAWRALRFNIVPAHSRLTSPDITTADVSERRRWRAIRWLVRIARLYFAVGVLCAGAGIVGVLKSNLRLTRLFLAHFTLDLLLTTLSLAAFLLLFTSPTLRAAVCEGFASGAKMQDWWFANANAQQGSGVSGAVEAVTAATATAVAAATRFQQQSELARLEQQRVLSGPPSAASAISDVSGPGQDASAPSPANIDALVEQTRLYFGPDSNCDEALVQIALPVCLCVMVIYTALRIHCLLCVNRFVAKLWKRECARSGAAAFHTGRGSLLPLVRSRGSASTASSSAWGARGAAASLHDWATGTSEASNRTRWVNAQSGSWLQWTRRMRAQRDADLYPVDEEATLGDEKTLLASDHAAADSDSDSDSDGSRTLVPTEDSVSSGASQPSSDSTLHSPASSASPTPRSASPVSVLSESSAASSSVLGRQQAAAQQAGTSFVYNLLRSAAAAASGPSPFSRFGRRGSDSADEPSGPSASRQAAAARPQHHRTLLHHRSLSEMEAQPMLGGMDVVTVAVRPGPWRGPPLCGQSSTSTSLAPLDAKRD